jgi:hypothetical protein
VRSNPRKISASNSSLPSALVAALIPPSATEPCPASDAEPPLNCPVLLPILRRTPDKQHANENERYEQHQEHDHNEGDIHTLVLSRSPPLVLSR